MDVYKCKTTTTTTSAVENEHEGKRGHCNLNKAVTSFVTWGQMCEFNQ